MLFLTYWKLNEEMSAKERQEIAIALTEEQTFPPDDVELVRWDGTPDGWGISLIEADDFAAVHNALNMWRTAAGDTPFFEETKTAPAAPSEDIIAQTAEMLEESPVND